MIKKLIVFILILSNTLFFSGCWGYTEIDKYSMVAGVAIDEGKNGYKYTFTFELINIDKKTSEFKSDLIEIDANTLFGGIRDMIGISSKKLSFTHCKLILINSKVAQKGVSNVLDSVIRDYEGRIGMKVAVSRGNSAREVLESKPVSMSIISYELVSIINQNPKYLSEAPNTEVYEMYDEINGAGIETVTPCFVSKMNDGEKSYRLAGTAVFKGDKVVGYLNNDESKAFLFIINQVKGGLITYVVDEDSKSHASMEVYSNKSSIEPQVVNGELVFKIKVSPTVTLANLEVGTQVFEYNEYYEGMFKQLTEAELEKHINDVLYKAQKQLNSDIFGMGDLLYKTMPKEWDKYKKNWNEVYKNVKVEFNVNVSIRGTGTTKSTIISGMEKNK